MRNTSYSYKKKKSYKLKKPRTSVLVTRTYQLIMLILLSITIGSCYSIESDCGNRPIEPTTIPPTPPPLPRDGFWEIIPGSTHMHRIACDANGNLLALRGDSHDVHFYNGTILQFISAMPGGLTGDNAIAVAPNGDAYVLGTVVFSRSIDGGINWYPVFSTDTILDYALAEIAISPSGDVYFATLNNGYVPNGNSWRKAI